MGKNIEKMYILNPEGRYKMNVAVCTKNQEVKKYIDDRKDITAFFSDDLDIDVNEYDLTIVDISMCSGRLDTAKMQSNRTVFMIPELTKENIEKTINNFKVDVSLFRYSFNGEKHTIDLNDVVLFESKHRQVRAYFENGESVRFYKKLDDVQEEIDNYVFFLRINKSCLINSIHCDIQKDEVTVFNRHIPVSRTYKKEFKERIKVIENM